MNDQVLNNMSSPNDEETIDLRKWMGKLLSNWYWFVLSVIVFGGGAYMLTKYIEPVYSVGSVLVVQNNSKNSGPEALFADMQIFGSVSNIQNEIASIKSWTLARRTLGQLNFDISYVALGRWSEFHLYENIPFRVTMGPDSKEFINVPIYVSIIDDNSFRLRIEDEVDLTHQFNTPLLDNGLNLIISRNPNFKPSILPGHINKTDFYFLVHDLDKLAYIYAKKLSIELFHKQSSVLRLNSNGFSAKKESDYLNTLMDEYIQSGLDSKNLTAQNTVDFIDEQLAGVHDTLRVAEANLTKFLSNNRSINLSEEGRRVFDQLEILIQEKTIDDMQLKYYENLLEYLKNSDDFTNMVVPSVMGINDPMLSGLIQKLVDLSSQKSMLEFSATNDFQAFSLMNLEIKNNQEALMENVRRNLDIAILKQEDVNLRISQLNTEIGKLPETERQYMNIQRSFNMADEFYTFLSQRRAEAAIIKASNVPDQIIIDKARVDAAFKMAPKSTMNYAIGLLLGLLIPFIIIVLRDFFNSTVNEKSDIENRTKVPILGTIGHNRKDEQLPSIKLGRSAIAESFRAIRTNLQFSLYNENSKVIMVTSSSPGEGKSFVAINLAGIYSVSDKKVVVVGLDLRKPTIQKYLTLDEKAGVSTHVIGKHSLDEIIQPTKYPNLSIITSGPIPPNPAELIETEAFNNFINELRTRFDIIILDTPPVAMLTDAMLIAKHSDATLYIVRQKHTSKSSISFINELSQMEHVKKLSIIINDVIVPKYYGYKYGHGYGYGYGKGHGSGYYVDDK